MAVVDTVGHDRLLLHPSGAGKSARAQQQGGNQDHCQSSLHVSTPCLS